MIHRIPLTTKSLARLAALKQSVEIAQSQYGVAMEALILNADIAGELTGAEIKDGALVVTTADVPIDDAIDLAS